MSDETNTQNTPASLEEAMWQMIEEEEAAEEEEIRRLMEESRGS